MILYAAPTPPARGQSLPHTHTPPTPAPIPLLSDPARQRIAELTETPGALIREYVWNGWEPVTVIEGGVISHVCTDHIGRPVFATNSAGAKVWTAS